MSQSRHGDMVVNPKGIRIAFKVCHISFAELPNSRSWSAILSLNHDHLILVLAITSPNKPLALLFIKRNLKNSS